jgi:hypothetical protein
MYLIVKEDSMTVELSKVVFDDNDGFVGKDIYIECDDVP